MSLDEHRALQALLAQMRTIHTELAQHHAGICVLHMEAAIAALESRLRQSGAPQIERLRQGLTSSSTTH